MMGALSGLGQHFRTIPEVQTLANVMGFVEPQPRRRNLGPVEQPVAKKKRRPKVVYEPLPEGDDIIDLEPGPDGVFKEKRS